MAEFLIFPRTQEQQSEDDKFGQVEGKHDVDIWPVGEVEADIGILNTSSESRHHDDKNR